MYLVIDSGLNGHSLSYSILRLEWLFAEFRYPISMAFICTECLIEFDIGVPGPDCAQEDPDQDARAAQTGPSATYLRSRLGRHQPTCESITVCHRSDAWHRR
nr:hypothetical protein CFP56_24044 [Quercus suber]